VHSAHLTSAQCPGGWVAYIYCWTGYDIVDCWTWCWLFTLSGVNAHQVTIKLACKQCTYDVRHTTVAEPWKKKQDSCALGVKDVLECFTK
jgi:hypothetical protein